jgi:glucokinase
MAQPRGLILAGDVGGTKTRLAFNDPDRELALVAEETFASQEQAGLEEIAGEFRARHPHKIARAAFGIAGPVIENRVQTTNLPWLVDAARLARALDLPGASHVILLNDLEATAWSLAALDPSQVCVLHAGAPRARGNRAIVAAGTGLGQAALYWDGKRHRPFATEGGHSAFAPRDELEDGLLRHLRLEHGTHVSWERVLSGPGLVAIYAYLRGLSGGAEEDLAQGNGEDPAAAISKAALEGRSPLAERALERFAALYGSQAGNLALTVLASGGVYLAGGIAPKVLPILERPGFLDAFLDKGRLRPFLEAVPVRVILDDRAPIYGAARRALAELEDPAPAGPA